MTIKEKARKIACGNCNICKGEPQPCGGSQYQIYTNCLKIAKEQQEIDIQRAWDYIESAFRYNTDTDKIMFDKEKLIQAMKGE